MVQILVENLLAIRELSNEVAIRNLQHIMTTFNRPLLDILYESQPYQVSNQMVQTSISEILSSPNKTLPIYRLCNKIQMILMQVSKVDHCEKFNSNTIKHLNNVFRTIHFLFT